MSKKIISLALSLVLGSQLLGYDENKAKGYEKFYSHMTQKACANSKLFIDAKDAMKMFKEGKKSLFIDVRSEGEASVFGFSAKNSMHIPINKLFEKQNLDKIPTDIPVIMVCHSGTRGTMAAMGLKQLGFKNIHVLKGGFVALANADTPAAAPAN